eukprot:NODE_42_length_34079_cov_0.552619.p18 type:complete len:146 gc:universal NODE_42_length_34079_cov_0.552619:13318-13755(+)
MQNFLSITINSPRHTHIHNKVFNINISQCNQRPDEYSILLGRNYSVLNQYRNYPDALKMKIAYFLIYTCKINTNYAYYAELLAISLSTFQKIGVLTVKSNPKTTKPFSRFYSFYFFFKLYQYRKNTFPMEVNIRKLRRLRRSFQM